MEKLQHISLTLILLTWRIGRAPNNASRWQMGFNLAFKGLNYSSVISLGSMQTRHFPGHLAFVTSLDTTRDPLITHIFCAGTAP
jgi:hypothetical protein